jgi:hypothetical protein
MAAVTGPVRGFPPPGKWRRRRVLLWGAVAWGVVVAALAVWSVGHSPATVPEQRTIGQAMPELQQAAGVVFAAATGPGRAVVLGGLQVASGCRVTPVRHGDSVSRDVTVYVRAGEQSGDIEAIAAALPSRYQVQVTPSRGGTRFVLHADAGNFIGIDLDATVGDAALTLRVSSGCRPIGADGVDRVDPKAGAAPEALSEALTALTAPAVAARTRAAGPSTGAGSKPWPTNRPVPPGAGILTQPGGGPAPSTAVPSSAKPSGAARSEADPSGADPSGADPVGAGPSGAVPSSAVPSGTGVTVQSVRCPAGGTAGTYTVGGVAAPKDWARRLGRIASGAAVVRSDTGRWAYRTGNDSVVVVDEGQSLRVSASTSC